MRIGYARTSTLEQAAGFEAQLRELQQAGCEGRIYQEQVSSVGKRPELDLLIETQALRQGDELVVTKLDRLARSVPDLLRIIERVQAKGAQLAVLNLGSTDPASPTGRLLLTVLGAIAAFEREMMLERQREGIVKAKAEGKYKGRKPTARLQGADVRRLKAEGARPTTIAKQLGISRASVYRILGEPRGSV